MQLPLWLKQNEFWINMFAYSHAMINPIIYITFNANFKKAFKRFLCCSNEFIPNEYSRNCEFMNLWSFEVWRNEFLRLLLLCRKLDLQCSARFMSFWKTFIYILFHFRFLINILLLTDNAKHELNNVGSLSPERTVLRTDSRVKVLAKDGLRRESGQGIVLGVVCHRCWLHWRRYWKIILKKRMDASFKNECKFCQVAIKYYSTK